MYHKMALRVGPLCGLGSDSLRQSRLLTGFESHSLGILGLCVARSTKGFAGLGLRRMLWPNMPGHIKGGNRMITDEIFIYLI
jgi:hypothetical protein